MNLEAINKAPYCPLPAIDALAEASTPEERSFLIRRIAATIGDEAALRNILGINPEEFANFYPDMNPPELSTEDTISSFISRFSSESAAETPDLEQLVVAPAIDYASLVAAEDVENGNSEDMAEEDVADENPDSTSEAISNFLAAVPPKNAPKADASPRKAKTPESGKSSQNAPILSETLWKVMVKNRNYVKALEIINELNLKNPKKSVYFADQKRFLEKLISLQKKSGNGAG